MIKYYKISGMNAGVPIDDYIIAQSNSSNDRTLSIHLSTEGDQVRYYEPATKSDYEKQLKKWRQ